MRQTLVRIAKAVDSPGDTWGRMTLVHALARTAGRDRELAGPAHVSHPAGSVPEPASFLALGPSCFMHVESTWERKDKGNCKEKDTSVLASLPPPPPPAKHHKCLRR